MRRFGLLIVPLLLILSVVFYPSLAQPDGRILTLLDTEPIAGEELATNGTITLLFDRALDCETVSSAVRITPEIAGELGCDGNRVTFTPATEFVAGEVYTVTVEPSLAADDGVTLSQTLEQTFIVAGALRVAEVFPASDETVINESVITVIFNRPVVPLVISEDQSDLPSAISITPEVAGQGEWLNTSIFQFTPDEPFAGGMSYTVTVNPDLTAIDGATLAEPFSWAFSTEVARVIETMPRPDDEGVLLDESIQVRFNQPMDIESTEAAFSLFPLDNPAELVTGTFEWADDGAGFRFTPDEQLLLETDYSFNVSVNARGANGGQRMQNPVSYIFQTIPRPAIVSTYPADGATDIRPFGGFEIRFASPINLDTIEGKITIEPEPEEDYDTYYSDYSYSYNLSFFTWPSAEYTVTIAPGIEDIYGNVIEEETVVTYRTAPYDPSINLQTYGQLGFYNAYREPTSLFLTHLNVSELRLSLYQVPLERFINTVTGSAPWAVVDEYTPASENALRSWTIPNVAPENALRYELLDLPAVVTGDDTAYFCPAAPESRLKVGDVVVVIAEPDALRARSEPVTGEIVELLYRDYALPIVGGPRCVDDFLWWEVELRGGERAWVAEGDPEEYYLDVQTASGVTDVVVADENGRTLTPGLYFLQVSSPETNAQGYRPNRHMLVVGTSVITMKASVDTVTVWVTDVQSGQPLADTPVSVYAQSGQTIASGITDVDGIFSAPIERVDSLWDSMVAVVDTDTHFGIGYSEWSNGIEPYNYGYNNNYNPPRHSVYIYTDRPIYRPGQPVYYRAVVRSQDDVTYTTPEVDQVDLTIRDAQGEIIHEERVTLSPFGTLSDEFMLEAEAGLGTYSIEIVAREYENGMRDAGYLTFNVGEFRLPEYQIEMTPREPQVVQGDDVVVDLNASYFFGGAVSDATVTYSVVAETYYFEYDGRGNYSFVDYDADSGPSSYYGAINVETIADGEGVTDENGNYSISFPAALEDAKTGQTLTVEATVQDESGQVVASRARVIVHKGLIYPGVEAEQYVGQEGEVANFNLTAVDWDSNPIANQPIDVEVVERRWFSVQEQDERGRTTWTWDVEEIPVTSASRTTDENGLAEFDFTPENGGVYKILVTTRDANGNEVTSATSMWVSSRQYVSWRQQNSNRIDLIADGTDYQIGDTAEILITSPFQGTAEALITVERGDVLKVDRVTMDSNSFIYQLPIEENFSPNVFVNVFIVKGVDENNPVAAFRAGMVQLGVDVARKAITIDISSDRETAQPQETVTYTINTTDYAGDPVMAEVGVAVTDLAALSVMGPNSQDILRHFYSTQALSVRTSTALTVNTDQLTQETLDTIKGGGGGFVGDGLVEIRGEFIDTPYWNGSIVTDENGTATIDVRLPDNLTTWRLDARAVTRGDDQTTLVGQDTFDLISTRPLIVRPVTPRFFVVEDRVFLGAVVNNNTGEDLDVSVTLQSDGLTLNSDASQIINIPAGARGRVDWEVTVNDVDAIQPVFVASAGDYTDASVSPVSIDDDGTLPVYRYEVPETVGTSGVLRTADTQTESIVLPRQYEVTNGELIVKVDQSLAASTLDALRSISNNVHQGVEQTVSLFLPNIMTYRALESLDLISDGLKDNLDTSVSFALQKLYAEQKANGGWGWYVNDVSNPIVTAYALIGIYEARQQGYAVADSVISRAQDFVRSSLVALTPSMETWRLNRQAFLLYALARTGAPDVARTTNLYDFRENLSYYAQAYLAEALYAIQPEDNARVDAIVSNLVSSAITSATGVHWEESTRDYWNWNTDTRTNAIILSLLTKTQPDSDLVPNVVRYLIVQREADAWETVQETAWSVMALTDWMLVSGELRPEYSYSVTLNDNPLTEGAASYETVRDSEQLRVAVADLLQDEANLLTFERDSGPGALYYTAHLNAYLPVEQVAPLDRGISISRRYVDPETGEPVTEGQVGDLVQARLTIIAPNNLHFVVIDDPLPAGAEGVDPNLETSQQIGTRPGLDNSDPLAYGWGWWWFSNIQFRDERVNLYSTYLPAGTYEYVYTIRLGVAGTFNVIPPTGQEFYFPEVYGRGAGSLFTITPADE